MFRTEVHPTPSSIKINLRDHIITLGSCFSDAIGKQLTETKFKVLKNPFGTVYNPHSIHKALRYALQNRIPPESGFLQHEDVFSHFDFHSSFSSLTQDEVSKKIKDTIGVVHYFLKDTRWVFLTYGTAWVYERNDTGEIVANCHKVPAAQFTKHLLSQKKILESFEAVYEEIKLFNPDCRIILTVSPVRHLNDSLPLNSVSKAVLRLACQTLSESYPNVFYFPAYEIMMDDLRDYRFYTSDMLHPSEEAEAYIWNKFSACYFDEQTLSFEKQWNSIRSALQHRPFNPTSRAHQQFLRGILKQLEALKALANVEGEIKTVTAQLV